MTDHPKNNTTALRMFTKALLVLLIGLSVCCLYYYSTIYPIDTLDTIHPKGLKNPETTTKNTHIKNKIDSIMEQTTQHDTPTVKWTTVIHDEPAWSSGRVALIPFNPFWFWPDSNHFERQDSESLQLLLDILEEETRMRVSDKLHNKSSNFIDSSTTEGLTVDNIDSIMTDSPFMALVALETERRSARSDWRKRLKTSVPEDNPTQDVTALVEAASLLRLNAKDQTVQEIALLYEICALSDATTNEYNSTIVAELFDELANVQDQLVFEQGVNFISRALKRGSISHDALDRLGRMIDNERNLSKMPLVAAGLKSAIYNQDKTQMEQWLERFQNEVDNCAGDEERCSAYSHELDKASGLLSALGLTGTSNSNWRQALTSSAWICGLDETINLEEAIDYSVDIYWLDGKLSWKDWSTSSDEWSASSDEFSMCIESRVNLEDFPDESLHIVFSILKR